jgi:hypothetical protein
MVVRINESGGRRYLQVVESYRNEAGTPRHRVVANLGRLDDKDGSQLDALIRGLCRAAGREEPAKVEITQSLHAPMATSSLCTRSGRTSASTAPWRAPYAPASASSTSRR